jgi:hypothetical protein
MKFPDLYESLRAQVTSDTLQLWRCENLRTDQNSSPIVENQISADRNGRLPGSKNRRKERHLLLPIPLEIKG